MKKVLFLLFALSVTVPLSSQDFKVKKGIVYIDEAPVLKMAGDCGVFKRLNYAFLSMSDDTLFKMKDGGVWFTDPRFQPIEWHEFTFMKNGQTIRIKKNATYVNDKQVIKFIYSFTPAIIKDGTTDEEAVSRFISQNDITADIAAATDEARSFEAAQKEAVLAPNLVRNLKMPIVIVRPVNDDIYNLQGFGNYSVFEIFQDKMFLGLIVQVNRQTGMDVTTSYYFMKRVSTPLYFKGVLQEFGMIAYLDNINTGFLENMHTREVVSFTAPVQSGDKMLDYTRHLIEIGCL